MDIEKNIPETVEKGWESELIIVNTTEYCGKIHRNFKQI
jgi:hypothetical protein